MNGEKIDLKLALEKAIELLRKQKEIEEELALKGKSICTIITQTCRVQIKIEKSSNNPNTFLPQEVF